MLKNNRLYPSRFSSRYYSLTMLRKAIEIVVTNNVRANSKLLDYGAGDAPYEPLFDKKVSVYIKADLNHSEVKISCEGKLPLESDSFNVVLSSQVLEHVPDVSLYLSECNRILEQNGTLILSTHGYWMYHPHPGDYWRWTKAGLKKVIEEHGFKVVENYGLMNLGASGLQLFQDWLGPRISKKMKVRTIFYYLISSLQLLIDRKRMNNEDAAYYVVVAKKILPIAGVG